MLSYRHAFHAGNHADVLKHCVLLHVLRHLAKKDAAFWSIDTHAGAPGYDLRGEYARKSGEAQTGIAKLWERNDLPAGLADYVELVRQENPDDRLVHYPGSPRIAERVLRKQDRLRLFELHSTEFRILEAHYAKAAPRVIAKKADGFDALLALLPPPPRRGLVLVDPSYEDKNDYGHALACLRGALERFASGTYIVWYPIVARREAQDFPRRLKRVRERDWVHVSLTVKRPPTEGRGLYGSGLHVINAPYTLPAMLKDVMPFLAKTLGEDAGAGYTLESRIA